MFNKVKARFLVGVEV